MLIARAPFRLSFAGGGTDLKSYYSRFEGVVVSTTITRYFYVFLSPTLDSAVQVISADFSQFERASMGKGLNLQGDLGYLKLMLREFGVTKGLSVFTASEVPPGTGLGSSSTVAVALAKALTTLAGKRVSQKEVARLASHFEIDLMKRPIGLQDQYAASYGGLNVFRFKKDGVEVSSLQLRLDIRKRIESSVLLFFTGVSRDAASILAEQNKNTESGGNVVEHLHGIRADAEAMIEAIRAGDVVDIGRVMDRSWTRKKNLADGISNPRIDAAYATALEQGALGGKIAGAGGGGFLLLLCEPDRQDRVTAKLEEQGLRRMTFHFDDGGAQVILNSMPELPGLRYPQLS
jgi:D-glycero-alpha-D-manno-heptose-7-phosphate kinase